MSSQHNPIGYDGYAVRNTHLRFETRPQMTVCGEQSKDHTTISLEHFFLGRSNAEIRGHIERLPELLCEKCVEGAHFLFRARDDEP